MERKAPQQKINCIKKTLKNSGQDELIFIITTSNKKVQVMNKLIDHNIIFNHGDFSCKKTNKNQVHHS